MAGGTPAAPIAARRALARLESANIHRPSERTGRAIEALGIALARVQERRRLALLPPTDKDVGVSHARGVGNP